MHRRGNRVSVESGSQRRLLTQKIAQDAIDQTAEVPAGNLSGSRNRLINHRMRGVRARFKTVKGDQQQGAHLIGGQRPFKQARQEKVTTPIGTEGTIDKILYSGPCHRIDTGQQPFSQTLPTKHGSINAGGLQKGEGERVVRQTGHSRGLSHAA